MNEHYGIIYKIENTVNHKVYIGQTVYSFRRRYGKNLSQCKNEYINADLEKYGIENFKITEVMDTADSKEELDRKEIEYIKRYNSTDRSKGYNIQAGGHNALHNEFTKEKIRLANLGENNPNYGKIGESNPRWNRKKMFCSNCGKPIEVAQCKLKRSNRHYCSVKCKKEDARNAIQVEDNRIEVKCACCGKTIKKYPSEIKNKKHVFCSLECKNSYQKEHLTGKNNPNYGNHSVMGGNNGRAEKVLCVETGKVFACGRDADRYYGFRIGSVGAVCRGDQKSTHGLHFKLDRLIRAEVTG